MNTIQIKNLTVCYGPVRALDQVSLTLEQGKIYGLLGRNGAGKTTLLNAITCRLYPQSGSITLDGIPTADNDSAQRMIYHMSEKPLFPDTMKVRDIFRWTQEFYPSFDLAYAQNCAKNFKLAENKTLRSLSTGYASILRVILALSVNTPFVLMDEPVLGLDANHREVFYKLLLTRYAEQGNTYLLSTHLVEEIASLLEDVIIIKNGHILHNEPQERLLQQGHAITGPLAAVDAFLQGKTCIGQDVLGGLKTAYLLGTLPQLPSGLERSPIPLQKLLIQLTNDAQGGLLP